MALKDLKSDLSKFRKPTNTPLEKKDRVDVPISFNTTPLSDKAQGKKIQSPNTTPEKVGVKPNVVKQGDKFKGETSPKPMSLVERYLGQTETTPVVQGDKFKGETTPTEASQGDKFKGETTPTEASQGDKFKGETTPTEVNQSEKFKGETTPSEFKFTQSFLGETTPKPTSLAEQFLGETTPNLSDRSSKFLGETTPNPSDRSSKFLGETTPNESDRSSKFLGETTPNPSDRSSKFLGETDTKVLNQGDKFKGETDTKVLNQGDKFKGETTPNDFTYDPILAGQALDVPQKVNFIRDDNASGFSPFMKGIDDTKFVGIDPNNTQFDSANSLLSNFDNSFPGLGFTPGYGQYKVGAEIAGSPRYSPNAGKYYDGGNFLYPKYTLEKISQQSNSPSFLDNMYNKFNLKDDAANRLSIIKQPYILRGIQRKKKTEPQNWDFGLGVDDGLIRGGTVTSVTRGVVDLLRMGSFFLSIKGLLWSARQFGAQKTNTFGRTWTPVNFLATVGGGMIGLHPDRSGKLLEDIDGKYQKAVVTGNKPDGKYKQKISDFYTNVVPYLKGKTSISGAPFASTLLNNGGPDSVYGIGITTTSRGVNTFENGSKSFGDSNGKNLEVKFKLRFNPFTLAHSSYFEQNFESEIQDQTKKIQKLTEGEIQKDKFGRSTSTYLTGGKKNIDIESQKYNPFKVEGEAKPDSYKDDIPTTAEEKLKFGVTSQTEEIDDKFKEKHPGENLLTSEGNVAGGLNDIRDYQAISYGKIKEMADESTGTPKLIPNDFREKSDSKQQKKLSAESKYSENNLEKKFKFGNPGKMLNGTEVRQKWNIGYDDAADFKGYYDELNASIPLDGPQPDIIPLIFWTEDAKKPVQFRGTISGLTENFSPSYTEVKYSGRAEPAYVYDTFKRDISFNFKVYPTSRIEMEPLWAKLERLSTYTMPKYVSSGYTAPGATDLKLTIGELYKDMPMILTTLGYTYSDDTPWDIEYKMPMGIDISVGCTVLGKQLHQYENQEVFSMDTMTRPF